MMFTLLSRMKAALAACCFLLLANLSQGQTATYTLGQFLHSADPLQNAVAFDVYLPSSSPWGARKPVLLFIPGGGFGQVNRAEVGPACQFYASQGYVAVAASYRTAPASPWPAQIEDVQHIVRILRQHSAALGVGKDRFAAIGLSAGGMLAGLLGSVDIPDGAGNSSKVQFVASLAGPWDLGQVLLDFQTVNFGLPNPQTATPPAGYPDFSALGTVANLFGISDLAAMQATFSSPALTLALFHKAQAASPVSHVTASSAPTALLHGLQDTVVPPAQTQIAYTRLQQAGVPSWVSTFPNAGHAPTPDMLAALHAYIVQWTTLTP